MLSFSSLLPLVASTSIGYIRTIEFNQRVRVVVKYYPWATNSYIHRNHSKNYKIILAATYMHKYLEPNNSILCTIHSYCQVHNPSSFSNKLAAMQRILLDQPSHYFTPTSFTFLPITNPVTEENENKLTIQKPRALDHCVQFWL